MLLENRDRDPVLMSFVSGTFAAKHSLASLSRVLLSLLDGRVALPVQPLADGIVLDVDVPNVGTAHQHLVGALLLPPFPIRGRVLDVVMAALEMCLVVLVRHGAVGRAAAIQTASVVGKILAGLTLLFRRKARLVEFGSGHGANPDRDDGQDKRNCSGGQLHDV